MNCFGGSFGLGRARFVFGTPLFSLELVGADIALENGVGKRRGVPFVPEALGTIASFQYYPRNGEVCSVRYYAASTY